jgi:N-acetylglucosaminyldiphosphoundecaprenol N-acetyl-beta-D-mannosaminyltransferase
MLHRFPDAPGFRVNAFRKAPGTGRIEQVGTAMAEARFQNILGIRFLVGDAQQAIDLVSRDGGVVVVPAAPALKNLAHDAGYREALLEADFAIPDSALMVLVWNLLQRDRIRKLSGLKYLRALIEQPEFRKPGASFWVMPSKIAMYRTRVWLDEIGIPISDRNAYVAPMYSNEIEDPELLRRIAESRPRHVVLGLGGGTQERLGLYLKRKLSYLPAIHCIGAAVAFLTGDQVRIPRWADTLGLGWMFRSFSDPKRYGPRYWDARSLAPLILRYRDRLPEISS